MRVANTLALVSIGVLAAVGCNDSRLRPSKLQSFGVTLLDPASAGSANAPLAYSRDGKTFNVDIEARDTNGHRLESFEGSVAVIVIPGEIITPQTVTLSGGVAQNVAINLRRSFGPSHIVVQDKSGQNFSAVGASTTLFFQNPRIHDVQQPTGTRDTSPLVGSVVNIDRGRNIVAHVSNEGFFVVDRDDTEYNSVFAFNFSRPDGIRRGDRLQSFGGQVSEFLGYTEIGFPNWIVDYTCPNEQDPGQVCDQGQFCINGICLGQECGDVICSEGSVCDNGNCVPNANVPDAKDVTSIITNNAQMERYEGGLVKITGAITSMEFKDCDNPTVNPGANGNGACEFCRTCSAQRDINGACPGGGRCCPVDHVCNLRVGECTLPCNANRDDAGNCPTGSTCCAQGEGSCTVPADGGMGYCGGCTRAEKAEAACDDECASRNANSPGGLCTNTCDYRDFGQYRVGLTDQEGRWNGQSITVVTQDTLSTFRPDATENLGTALPMVRGTLSNVYAPTSMWILTPRDECDVEGVSRTRTDCAKVR